MKPEDPTECRQTHFREGCGLGTRLALALQRITLNFEPYGSGRARTFELKWPRGASLQRRAQALQVRNIGDNNKDVLHTIAVFSSEIKWLGLLPYFTCFK